MTEETDSDEPVTFYDFFRKEPIEIDVSSGLRQVPGCPEISSSLLCRDFCLTIGDDLVILAGSSPTDCSEIENGPPKSYLVQSSGSVQGIANDSHSALPCLDHVTFFLVSLKTMKVVDFLHFKYDFIYLAHHLGVGLEDGVFSVLSIKNQRIFMFDVSEDLGFFPRPNVLARNSIDNLSDLQEVLIKIPDCDGAQSDASWRRPGISGFTLKLIRWLILNVGLHRIPQPSSILSSLHIWKHQLLSGNKILLRLAPISTILSTNPRHQSMVHALDPLPTIHKNSYLVLMDANSFEIDSVMNSADPRMFEWIEDNWKWLRGRSVNSDDFAIIKSAMNVQNQNQNGNALIRRFSNTLPLSPQQFADTPWLDSSLFRWDPKVTAALSRMSPISCNYFSNSDGIANPTGLFDSNYGSNPVRFFSRQQSNLLSHVLQLVDPENVTSPLNSDAMDRHKWFNLIMHPTLPLILIYQYGIFRSLSIKIYYN